MLKQDIVREATRLTRSGRLVEATALLQRMLRGETAPDSTAPTARRAPAGREPLTIDAKPNTAETMDPPRTLRTPAISPRISPGSD